ncbi:MAG: lasso peptide isopeptide bond-forming cyclase [Cyanobacteria bacterium J06623_7]
MSGIVGIYQRRGFQSLSPCLENMMGVIAHRGNDGSHIWQQDHVGLGHVMLWTTPESKLERLPYCDSLAATAITADARIDNRAELMTLLGLEENVAMQVSDSYLILKAYHKWGTKCPTKLIGDFAFAIWDGTQQRLFCARDHFGVKPFYYCLREENFTFASEIKAVLAGSQVSPQLNDSKVADYLIGDFDDTARTFYQHILRLSPAHCLTITADGVDLECYWSLDPNRQTRLESNAAYAKEFQRLFTEAVRCRLRGAFPIGSELSGGLDSSAVSCVARNILQNAVEPTVLHTLSAVFDEVTECDEREYINEAIAQTGIEPHYFQGDRRTPLTDLQDIFWHEDEAFFAPGFAGMTWGLCTLAKDRGIRILLNGNDGDSTVSHGFGYLHDLARQGRWLTLYREMRGVAKIYNESAIAGFWNYFSAYMTKKLGDKHRYLRRVLKIGGKIKSLVRDAIKPRGAAPAPDFASSFVPEFVARTDLRERYHDWLMMERRAQTSSRTHHYRLLTQGAHALALEINDKAAAAFGLEMRYPFWDKRLVEFCLSLPAEQKLAQGWSRVVMRRGMEGILPPKIQWRTSKMDFAPNFKQGLLGEERQQVERLLADPGALAQYIDLDVLGQKYREGQDWQFIWRAVSLGLWLDYANFADSPQLLEVRGDRSLKSMT